MKEKIPNPYKMQRIQGPDFSHQDWENTKVRITTHLDGEIVTTLKALAEESGGKYQTLLNQILRDYLFDEKKGILTRLSKLEKAVFKRRKRA